MLPVTFACVVPDDQFDPVAYFGPKDVRRQDRVTQLGFAAAADAIEDAGDFSADPARCSVIASSGIGGLQTLEENARIYFERGASRVTPFFVPMTEAIAIAYIGGCHVSVRASLSARAPGSRARRYGGS